MTSPRDDIGGLWDEVVVVPGVRAKEAIPDKPSLGIPDSKGPSSTPPSLITPSLPTLPVELVEHILDYLPHRDTLLHLRLVCRDINAKISRRFAKAYFDEAVWRLSATSTKSIVSFTSCPDIASNITNIRLIAPSGCYGCYDNIWSAKNIDPAHIAKAFSFCTQADSLILSNLRGCYEDSENFLSPFAQNLHFPKLKDLTLSNAKIHSETVILLQKKHCQTLESVKYHGVELINPKNEHRPCLQLIPWVDVLASMQSFKNNCSIHICAPNQVEGWTMLTPPWEDWQDASEVYDGSARYQYMGLTIQEFLDEDDKGLLENRIGIDIEGDAGWWKGVKRVLAYGIFETYRDQYVNTEELPQLDVLDMYDDDDEFWDQVYDDFMDLKKEWAREARKADFIAQKKGKAGAVAKKYWESM